MPSAQCVDYSSPQLLADELEHDNGSYTILIQPELTTVSGDKVKFTVVWSSSMPTRTVKDLKATVVDDFGATIISNASSPENEGDTDSGTSTFTATLTGPIGEEFQFTLTPEFTGAPAIVEYNVALECIPVDDGGGDGGGEDPDDTNADSKQINAVQQAGTGVAAQISSEVITDATGNAITGALSGQIQVLSASDGRVGLQYAPDMRRGGTIITPTADVSGLTSESALRFWADLRYTDWDANGLDGNQVNGLVGASILFGEGKVAGLVVGYENLNYENDAGATLDGSGFSFGGYLGGTLAGRLRFDTQLHYALLGYDVESGAVSGDFDASRLIASGGFTHAFELGALTFEPTLRATGTWEWQDGYTDSADTEHDSQNFSFGRVSVGSKVSRALELGSGGALVPFVAVHADYRFSEGDTTVDAYLDGMSVRLGAGFDIRTASGITAGVLAEVFGLGLDDDVLAKSVRANLNIPF